MSKHRHPVNPGSATVEEKVVALQEKKKSLYEAFIKSGEEGVSSLTVEDIKFILS